MLALKRNQVIVSALVVMIAVAGYLNYIDTGDKTTVDTISLTEEGEVSALVYDEAMAQEIAVVNIGGGELTNAEVDDNTAISVSAEESGEVSGAAGSAAGEAVFVNSTDSSYFIQAKLEREQARSSQKSSLTDIINNDNVDETAKAQSAETLLNIQSRIEKETAAEALIEAKGFDEVYVRIGDDTVDVVVNKAQLTDVELAQIEDIVTRNTGFAVEDIYISPLQAQ